MKHTGPISGVATLGEDFVATAGYDNQVILWDAGTGDPLHRVFHDHLANQCTFSPSGGFLATASSDYTARIWDVPSLRLRAVLNGHDDDIEMVAVSPDSTRVATCSRDHTVGVYDLDGRRLHRLRGHEADVISVAWDAGGVKLITSSDDGTVRSWDAVDGLEIGRVELDGVETDTIAVSDRGVIYAGNDEGEIVVIRDGAPDRVPAHRAGVKRVMLSGSGNLLASLSYDRTLMLWSVGAAGELTRFATSDLPPIVWPRSCAFLGRSKVVFGTFGSKYATYDYVTDGWDVSGIEAPSGFNAVAHLDGSVYAIGDAGALHRDGVAVRDLGSLCNFLLPLDRHLVTGGQLGICFDAMTGERLYQHNSPLNCAAAFERDGVSHVVVGAYTGEGIVFRQEEGRLVHLRNLRLHDNAVKGVAASADTIFSVCATGAAAWHRIDDFSRVAQVEDAHDKIANGCATLPPNRFASISRDLRLRIWDGQRSRICTTPSHNSIKCIAASRDGRYIACGTYVGVIMVFDVHTGQWTHVSRPVASGISCITVAPGEGTFTASSYDGKLHTVRVGQGGPA